MDLSPRRRQHLDSIVPKRRLLFGAAAAALVGWIGFSALELHRRAFLHGGVNLDGIAYRYQLETFALGRLANPSPPLPEFFSSWGVLDDGQRAYSKYFPGHALVMLPLYAACGGRIEPLAPALAALAALAVAAVAGLLGGGAAAIGALALLGLSPFFLMTGATMLSHVTCLLAHALAVLALLRARRVAAPGRAALLAAGAGLAAGLALATRPLTALGLALPAAGLLVLDLIRGRPAAAARLAAAGTAFAAVGALLLAYNAALTGDPLRTPFSVYWPPDRLGFGPWRGQGPDVGRWEGPFVQEHTPGLAVQILGKNLGMLDRWLLGFQGSLVLLLGLVGARLAVTRLDAERALLLALLGLQPLLYMLLWFEGLNHTGPIYYFEMWLPLAALGGWAVSGLARGRGLAVAALVAAAAAAAGLQLRVRPALEPLEVVTRLQERDLEAVRAAVRPPAVVFLPETRLGKPLSSLVNGPEPLRQPILFALDRGEDNRRLMEALPGRKAWRLVILPAEPRPIGWRVELLPLEAPQG
jgi:hypothetical protein